MPNCYLSICILSHNRASQIIHTLKNIENQRPIGSELLILDNGSIDGSERIIEDFVKSKKIHFFRSQVNLGVSGGRSYLLQRATGKHILMLDDDIILSGESIKQMLVRSIHLCDSALISPSIKDSVSGRILNSSARKNIQGFYEACFLIPKCIIDKVGYFDEKLSVAGEGLDYFIRLQKSGFFVERAPEVEVFHFDRGRSIMESEQRRKQWLFSFTYVYWKHYSVIPAIAKSMRILLSHIRAGFPIFGIGFTIRLVPDVIRGALAGMNANKPKK